MPLKTSGTALIESVCPVWNVHASVSPSDVVRRDRRQLAVAPAGVVAVIGGPGVGRRREQRRRLEPAAGIRRRSRRRGRGWRGLGRGLRRDAAAQRPHIRQHVVHVGVGVLRDLIGVRVERIVDGELHQARGPRAVPAVGVAEGDRELVAEREPPFDALTGRQRDLDLGRRALSAASAAGIEHPLQQREPLEAIGHTGEVLLRVVAGGAAAGAVEVLLAGARVAGVQVVFRDLAPGAEQRSPLDPLIVDERDDRRQVGVADRQRRHALVGPSVADDRADLVPLDVVGHDLRAREVRPGFTAGRVAPVAEAAVGDEERLAGLHLIGGIGDLRRRRRLPGRAGDDDGAKQQRRPKNRGGVQQDRPDTHAPSC